MKKYILGLIIAFSIPATLTFAATPTLSLSANSDGTNVVVTITHADANTPIALYFKSTTDGNTHSQVIGNTDGTGMFSGNVNTSSVGINSTTPVYVIVNGSTSNSLTWPYYNISTPSQVAFSQSNTSVAIGQIGTLTVSGGSGTYYISSNSNSSAVTASISGSTLSFSGIANGSAVITVCSTSGGTCSLTTISTSGTTNTGGLTLSPSTLNIVPNQMGTVQISGGNAPYTIAIVTGDNVFYTFSGSMLTINGTINGARLLNVCSSNNICSSLTVNISGTSGSGITLSPSTINLTPGQSGTVQISGGATPYTVYTISGNSLTTSVSGSMLTLSGSTGGTTSINICGSNGVCSALLVNIGITNPTPSSSIGLSYPLAINQVVLANLTGGNGSSYYLQSAVSYPVAASISGSTLTVVGKAYGTSMVTVCQSGNATCLPITFMVNQTTVPVGTGGPHTFNDDLWFGQTSSEVTELQKVLISQDYLSSSATGYFGSMTQDAIRKYQAAKGISTTGYVGPLTRAALNNN
jgi:hypothetical protein